MRELTCFDVVLNVESSTKRELNVELVDTCNRYDVAPVEAFQLNVRVTGCAVAPLLGDESVGVAGGVGRVVKLQALEYALVPLLFLALTRQ